MFPSPLWVVLVTLVLFNRAAKIENMDEFNYIVHFKNSTTPSSKIELFHLNGTLNETVDEKDDEKNSTSETNSNSILNNLASSISSYITPYFNSSCETPDMIPADDEVCVCKNSTVLFFFKKNNCFLIKKFSNIRKKKQDSH